MDCPSPIPIEGRACDLVTELARVSADFTETWEFQLVGKSQINEAVFWQPLGSPEGYFDEGIQLLISKRSKPSKWWLALRPLANVVAVAVMLAVRRYVHRMRTLRTAAAQARELRSYDDTGDNTVEFEVMEAGVYVDEQLDGDTKAANALLGVPPKRRRRPRRRYWQELAEYVWMKMDVNVTDSLANRELAKKLIKNICESHQVRTSHVVRHLPWVIERVFTIKDSTCLADGERLIGQGWFDSRSEEGIGINLDYFLPLAVSYRPVYLGVDLGV